MNLKRKLIQLSELIGLFYPRSYSQDGEDMIIREFFFKKRNGFFVDIGAHHPKRFSNTYYYYRKGWTGINMDAMPGSMKLFTIFRRRDINLEVGIGNEDAELDFHIFNETALNTFDASLAKKYSERYTLLKIKKVKVVPLAKVLDQYIKQGEKISFFSIDVEGKNFEVLQSNNWEKYSPQMVLVENDKDEILNKQITDFLVAKNYSIYAQTMRTFIFKAN